MFKPHGYLQEENGGEGGDQGGGAGGEGGDKGGGENKNAESNDMLMRGMAVIARGISEMQESNKAIAESLKGLSQRGAGDDDGEGDKGNKGGRDDLFSGVDMEQLDRKEFASLLLTKFQDSLTSHLKESMKPLEERVGQVSSKLEEDLANREVNSAAGQRPDFYEWRPEISALVKENPSLSVTRAYTIARSENADKAKQMDTKYAKKSDTPARGFTDLSLSPTGGGGRGEDSGKMKFNEAAEKAYEDVLASLGGVQLDQLPVVGGKRG
jgi:hypothetical protein